MNATCVKRMFFGPTPPQRTQKQGVRLCATLETRKMRPRARKLKVFHAENVNCTHTTTHTIDSSLSCAVFDELRL
jgi:hypothetical protein